MATTDYQARQELAARVRAFYSEGAGVGLNTAWCWIDISREALTCNLSNKTRRELEKHVSASEEALRMVESWIAALGYEPHQVSQFLTYSRSCVHPWSAGHCDKCPPPPDTAAEVQAKVRERISRRF